MTDELLHYYEQELAYFRQVAPEFARRHPTIAGRLRMSEEEIDDPHVERLIQAVAFLNARTRRKIDDDFPEISQALLQVLYPHYPGALSVGGDRAIRAAAGSGGVGPGLLDRARLEPGDGTDRRRALSIPDLLPGNRVAASS